jgi:hypothetical protein
MTLRRTIVNRPTAIRAAAAVSLLAALALAPATSAHPPATDPPAGHAPAAPTAAGSSSVNMQGNDAKAWAADAHIHAFYDTTVAAFAQGPAKVDVDAYEQKSFAIFRAFGEAKGVGAAAMQDHLKLIPRQVVGIVKEDPKVLDSYENFILALMGPE